MASALTTSNGHIGGTSEADLSKLDEMKQTISTSLQALTKLLKASREPLPTETDNGTVLIEGEHTAGLGETFATALRDVSQYRNS
jgi:hypothetical protein